MGSPGTYVDDRRLALQADFNAVLLDLDDEVPAASAFGDGDADVDVLDGLFPGVGEGGLFCCFFCAGSGFDGGVEGGIGVRHFCLTGTEGICACGLILRWRGIISVVKNGDSKSTLLWGRGIFVMPGGGFPLVGLGDGGVA